MTTKETTPSSYAPPPLTDAQREATIAWLRARCDGDAEDQQEQRETWEYLKKALDEDRPAGFKLFEKA